MIKFLFFSKGGRCHESTENVRVACVVHSVEPTGVEVLLLFKLLVF